MKSNCMKREQIFALAESMLSAREEEQARAHVSLCEDCRKVFENYRRVDSVLDEWMPEAEPSPWFDARMRAAVAAAGSAKRSRGFLGLTLNRWLALPAMASLLVMTGVVAYRDLRSRPSGGPGNPAAVTSAARAVQAAPAAQVANPAGAPAHETAMQELKMYQNLPVLEDYDMLADFDVISELPKGSGKVAD